MQGAIIAVHFIVQERHHALKYPRAVLNPKASLQHLKMTGISDYLLTKRKNFYVITNVYKKRCEWSSVCKIL